MQDLQVLIDNQGTLFIPVVEDGVTWQTDRQGVPSSLKFSTVKDEKFTIEEGNAVLVTMGGVSVFYGFVFVLKTSKEGVINVTAYDQLRYFKNKETYNYSAKKASEVLTMIAEDFLLNLGTVEDTAHIIAARNEDGTLFDTMQNALDATLQNTGEMFVLYDDAGKLTLKNLASMTVPYLLNKSSAENYDFSSSIDGETYNKIKLRYQNDEEGINDVYIAQSSENINLWGVLQLVEDLEEGENGKSKADALLSLYNQKTRALSVKKAIGDVRVRAGCMIGVQLTLGGTVINNWMLVEKCKHSFNHGEHTMDLNLRGGEINSV